MPQVSYSDLRSNLARYMDEVCDSRAPLLVTRQNARSVVIVSEDEYESMVETMDLLRSPVNAARLLESIAEADEGALQEADFLEAANSPGK
jgi:antitoxin YefM